MKADNIILEFNKQLCKRSPQTICGQKLHTASSMADKFRIMQTRPLCFTMEKDAEAQHICDGGGKLEIKQEKKGLLLRAKVWLYGRILSLPYTLPHLLPCSLSPPELFPGPNSNIGSECNWGKHWLGGMQSQGSVRYKEQSTRLRFLEPFLGFPESDPPSHALYLIGKDLGLNQA